MTYGQSLEVYLQESTVIHRDAHTGIQSNQLVTQVKVPMTRNGKSFEWKVDFTPRGSQIFLQVIGLITDSHISQMSWNGLVYPGMFGILKGQVFLRPRATA